jgi:hypothetical protein
MVSGVDPKAKQEAARKAEARRRANSFEAVASDFILRHVSKLRTGRKEEAAIRRELMASWGERPVTDISRADVIEAIERLADAGKLHASHQLLATSKRCSHGQLSAACTGSKLRHATEYRRAA